MTSKNINIKKRFRFLFRFTPIRVVLISIRTLHEQFGLSFHWVSGIFQMIQFAAQYRHFRRLNAGTPFKMEGKTIAPYLLDSTTSTPVEPTYFLQDTWFARKIAEHRPISHVDVGSMAKSISIISQFVPLTMVDIRPVEIAVPGFTFLPGSILNLPFPDHSQNSISSLCVIEHIGLGRYGDSLDATGSEKAIAELLRVTALDGNIYVSVPIDATCSVHFNAHRTFTRNYFLSLFSKCLLKEEKYIYGNSLCGSYKPELGFGTGLYYFRRT
jgi:SAM-dependent methyltransferase